MSEIPTQFVEVIPLVAGVNIWDGHSNDEGVREWNPGEVVFWW